MEELKKIDPELVAESLKSELNANMKREDLFLIITKEHSEYEKKCFTFDKDKVMKLLIPHRNKLIDDNYQKYIKEKERRR